MISMIDKEILDPHDSISIISILSICIYKWWYLSIYLSIDLSIYLYDYTYLSIYLSIYLSVWLSVCLSVHPSIHRYRDIISNTPTQPCFPAHDVGQAFSLQDLRHDLATPQRGATDVSCWTLGLWRSDIWRVLRIVTHYVLILVPD
jgi:hypothetical protein